MIKRILLFLVIIVLPLAFYFYQSGAALVSLPAFSETGQVINSQKISGDSTEKKEMSLPAPLKISDEWLSSNPDGINLTDKGIIRFTNQERSNKSLLPLNINEKLNSSAKAKLDDMFQYQYFEHRSPKGQTLNDLIRDSGYDYILIGENLAEGDFRNDQALVSAWMASPHHRANILNDRYTEIGVAVGRGLYKNQKVWLAIQHFGRPAGLCPAIDHSLKETIERDRAALDALSKKLNLTQEGTAAVWLAYLKDFGQVKEYNKLAEETKIAINLYNSQVEAFNACIQK